MKIPYSAHSIWLARERASALNSLGIYHFSPFSSSTRPPSADHLPDRLCIYTPLGHIRINYSAGTVVGIDSPVVAEKTCTMRDARTARQALEDGGMVALLIISRMYGLRYKHESTSNKLLCLGLAHAFQLCAACVRHLCMLCMFNVRV